MILSLFPVTGQSVIDKLIAENDYYAEATIKGGLYKGTDSRRSDHFR